MASSKMIGRGTPSIQSNIPRPMILGPCDWVLVDANVFVAVEVCATVPSFGIAVLQ
jgi:hypothetical protein